MLENVRKTKVFVGLSGGVDSSVAAHLLREQGYDVVGVFLRCYNIDGCAVRDAEDARRVAEHLGIPFYVFDFEKEYKEKVVEYMIEGYRAGLTPNPDVMCNKEIKFGMFLERALKLGADFVATGHYVKRVGNTLAIAKDLNKDQSYFLWTLTQEQLKCSLFPLGDLTKPEVREIAKKIGLPTAEKKDSQGVCFLGMIDMKGFLSSFIKPERGEVRSISGELLGYHQGVRFFTIGQRHLDIEFLKQNTSDKKNLKDTTRKPYYVARRDVKNNILFVAEGNDSEALTRKSIDIAHIHLVNNALFPQKNGEVEVAIMARVRYRQPLFSAKLIIVKNEGVIVSSKIDCDIPQRFVAEGQSAVFYSQTNEMLGGGIII